MSEGVYRNGLPHPSASLRARIALELFVLALLTSIFLYYVETAKKRNSILYVGMALIGFALIGLNARDTRERIWGPPEHPAFDRVRSCALFMTLLTVPPILVLLILGIVGRYWGWYTNPVAMFGAHFWLTLALYLPWALLQQYLFQFYLLGRFRALLPFASPVFLCMLNGIIYGLLHVRPAWSDVGVTIATMVGGVLWSYSYYHDRYVLPIAISHALLGTTFYYWAYGRDLIAEMQKAFAG
ncbi:MAG TPA: CPBP family glutamic-type intramembrane protease [Planctomycetota bacterium]